MDRGTLMRVAGIVLLIAGIISIAAAIASGEAKIALVLIIPVIYGTGVLAALGILLIFGGMTLLFLSFFTARVDEESPPSSPSEKTKREYGGVILIGPIPIVFGSAKSLKGSRLLLLAAVLSLFVLLLYLILILR